MLSGEEKGCLGKTANEPYLDALFCFYALKPSQVFNIKAEIGSPCQKR